MEYISVIFLPMNPNTSFIRSLKPGGEGHDFIRAAGWWWLSVFDPQPPTLICQVQRGGVLPSVVLQHNLIHASVLFGNLTGLQGRESDTNRGTESPQVLNWPEKASFIFLYGMDAAEHTCRTQRQKSRGTKNRQMSSKRGILRQDGMTTTTATTNVPNFKRFPEQHFCKVFCVCWELALKWDHTECYQRLWHDAAGGRWDREERGGEGFETQNGKWSFSNGNGGHGSKTSESIVRARAWSCKFPLRADAAVEGLKQSFAFFKVSVSKDINHLLCFLLA